jgi:hypothetical protein
MDFVELIVLRPCLPQPQGGESAEQYGEAGQYCDPGQPTIAHLMKANEPIWMRRH